MSLLSHLKSMYNDLTRSRTLEDYNEMLKKVIKRLEFNKTFVVDFLYLTHGEKCHDIVKTDSNFNCVTDEDNFTHFRSKDDSLAFTIYPDFKTKGVVISEASDQLFFDIINQSRIFLDSEGYYFTNNELEDFENFEFAGSKILFHKLGNPKSTIELVYKKLKHADIIIIGMKLNY